MLGIRIMVIPGAVPNSVELHHGTDCFLQSRPLLVEVDSPRTERHLDQLELC